MAERGRPSASSGNAYHDIRVAHWLIDLLEDASLTSVAVETLDAIDDLVIRRSDGKVRYEQVKERTSRGTWTAKRLTKDGVIDQFVRQHQNDPNGEFVFYTASVASDFREVAERARNAFANYPCDESGRQAALAEWNQRLQGKRRFVNQILHGIAADNGRQTITHRDLHSVLARVYVLDASGTLQQHRERAVKRLRLLVEDPERALQTLEQVAHDAAIRRGILTRPNVEAALLRDGCGPRFAAFALNIDQTTYAEKIQQESTAIDVAKLPSMEPQFQSPPRTPFQLAEVTGKTVLFGGHGAGKSRIASELSIRSLRDGRRCLHIRLARWATTLCDLVLAELSQAATRHARQVDFDNLFRDTGVLVLDGLDEVPYAQRLAAEREILQFSDTHPHLDILVTCRPGSGRMLSQHWRAIHLQPLTREQVYHALNGSTTAVHLTESLLNLATNPLMLGLLNRQIRDGMRPSSEANLLDAFVTQIVARESHRSPAIDIVSGNRLAEDVAFEWLSSGRIALLRDQMREVAASVALLLRNRALLLTDAYKVEHWLQESGIAIELGDFFVPVHRAVLDHLAGRSMVRRYPSECALRPELREAVARYIGAQTEVSETMLSLLNAVGNDLELLARGRLLTSQDIVWPFEPMRFAEEYLAELRRLGTGPLVDVGVVNRAVEIDVDQDVSWITERERIGSVDVVKVVDTPSRLYISDSDGSNRVQVHAFRLAGHRGAEVSTKVPHFAAFARVKDELESLLQHRFLPNEGPDIVYERLCFFAHRFLQTMTAGSSSRYKRFRDVNFRNLTASALYAEFTGVVAEIEQEKGTPVDMCNTLIMYIPNTKEIVVCDAPYSVEQNLDWPLRVHGRELTELVSKCIDFGIQEIPLHPLALLPNSVSDSLLRLPNSQDLLHGDALKLYVQRHELGEMRGFRYLIEHNLSGLARFLQNYSTMPWRIEIAIEESETGKTMDARTRAVRSTREEFDEVVVVSEVAVDGALWASWSRMVAYEGVMKGAYKMVENDLKDLMSGTNPLGSDIL